MQNIIELLRMPHAPNAVYHKQCYVPQKDELVLEVLRLKDDALCTKCKQSISKGLAYEGSSDVEEKRIAQQSLWDLEVAV